MKYMLSIWFLSNKNRHKILFLTGFIILGSVGYVQKTATQQLHKQTDKLDSLKISLSMATDSLEVARLCQEIYRLAKFKLLIPNPEEGNYLMRALRIYESHEKWDEAGRIYNSLGGIYYNRHLYSEARKYWNLSKEQHLKTNNLRRQLIAHNNLALTYDSSAYGQKQMKAHLDSAIQLGLSLGDSVLLISPYENLGSWYINDHDFAHAEKYTNFSYAISEKLNRYTSMQSSTLQLGMIRKKQGRLEQAIGLIEKSLGYNALRKTDSNYLAATLELSRLYRSLGNYKKAYAYQFIYQQYKDTLFHEQHANALLNLQMIYETEKKERVILAKESELQLLGATARLKTRLIWAISIGTVLLFGSAYLYRSYRFALREKKMEANFSRQLLSSHEEERKRISRDLHDSVGQSLILIKNKVVLNQDDATVTMVSQALEEVRTISKALHPEVLEKLGLTASIKKIIKDADELTDIFFTEEIAAIDEVFPKDHELQLYRIAQEAINNVIKHAQTKSALISVNNGEKKVTLLIQDYGVGFDITENSKAGTSLGMKTLKERTQILGGKMIIDSTKNKGTSIFLELDKPHINA